MSTAASAPIPTAPVSDATARTYDAVVVGAGIVGLATAYQLMNKNPGWRVAVLEKEPTVGAHQTGNNSGVLHSGIYYKPGSLKAQNCRRGLKLMVAFCQEHAIAHEICGKVIVATNESELPALQRVFERGQGNGVRCSLIEPERLRELEPHCAGIRAIHVEEAGIVDYPGVCRVLARLIEEHGGSILTSARVTRITQDGNTLRVFTPNHELAAGRVINCGGLHSDRVADLTPVKPDVRIVPFRGEYYMLSEHANKLVNNLIYPVPDPRYPFLGVHYTRMVNGDIECGPNAVLALSREGYRWRDINLRDMGSTFTTPGFWRFASKHWRTAVSEMHRSASKGAFLRSLQALIPEVRMGDIRRAGAGVRAQAMRPTGDLADDFAITSGHGVVNVCNAPSPAATASLSIGDSIAEIVQTQTTIEEPAR